MNQGDDETRARLEAETRKALKANAADDRSPLEKAEAIIDAPFRVVKVGLKLLVLLLLVVIVGGAVWFLALRGHGGSSRPQDKIISQKTIPAKPISGSDGSTPPATDQPTDDSSDTPQPVDGTPTADQWNVGTQIMNLKLAVVACLNQKMMLRKSTAFSADYCSDPSNLQAGGYTVGDGPDQVQVGLSVTQTTVDQPHKVTFHDQHGVPTTQILHGTTTYNDISGVYSGETADGEVLSIDPSGQYITNDQNQALFWLLDFPEPPCPTLAEGQSCLVQPTEISDSGYPEEHGSTVVKSETYIAD